MKVILSKLWNEPALIIGLGGTVASAVLLEVDAKSGFVALVPAVAGLLTRFCVTGPRTE